MASRCHKLNKVNNRYATEDNIKTLIGLIKQKFNNYMTSEEIKEAIGNISRLSFKIVPALPNIGDPNVIYMVPNYGSSIDNYDEYYWDADNSRFESLGSGKEVIFETDELIEMEYESSIKPHLNKRVIIKAGDR